MTHALRSAILITLSALVTGSPSAQAQLFPKPGDPEPATASAIAFYNIGKRNILESAEKMPAEHYSYQPTEDVRTFGQIIAHIADTQFIFCSSARKEPNPNGKGLQSGEVARTIEQSGKKDKGELLAALKQSFEFCDRVYSAATADAAWNETVKLNNADRPMSVPIILELIHMWEHYGNLATYMREKGIVPPSSDRTPPQPRR